MNTCYYYASYRQRNNVRMYSRDDIICHIKKINDFIAGC